MTTRDGLVHWAMVRMSRPRFLVQGGFDGACWAGALFAATFVRFDFALDRVRFGGLGLVILLAVAGQALTGYLAGLYRGLWRYGSFDEVAALARTAVTVTVALLVVDRWAFAPRPVPLSAPVSGGFMALVLMAAVRYSWRLALEHLLRPSADNSTRLLIFGAGEGGHQVVSAMMRDPASRYFPIGFVDDDPSKRHLSIVGVHVVGNRTRIRAVAEELRADALLIAIPSAGARLVGEITELAEAAGLPVKVLPPVSELYGTGAGLGDIRDLRPADLLGRRQVETDIDAIAGYVTGRRVLVTGAGGSIGSELCRQLDRLEPAELIMLDRDESALHAVQLSIDGRALLDSPNLVLCDIRDTEVLDRVLTERRPEVVFHAAALKHLTLLERAPGEAVKTNVWGTLTVLEAAAAAEVTRFVNISTDKAADPISVLGYSKRIAERLTAGVAGRTEGVFLSVRFGNVLGSRGSVLTAFRAQTEQGRPLTVTDPDVTRYFMTVEEAVQLVIQAGAIGRDGEALVLEMGEPVRIADVAGRMAAQCPRAVEVVYTGLRPGEKLHEVLLGEGEIDHRPIHPLISHVAVPPIDGRVAWSLDPSAPAEKVIAQLRGVCFDDVDCSDLGRLKPLGVATGAPRPGNGHNPLIPKQVPKQGGPLWPA